MANNPGFSVSTGSGGTSAVYIDSTAGTINVALKPGTIAVSLDPGYTLGAISGINNSIAVHLLSTAGTINVALKPGTIAVQLDPGHLLGNVGISSMPTTSGVYLAATAGTLGVRVGQIDGTVAVYFSPANPSVAASFSGSIAAVPQTGSGDALYDETTNAVKVQQVNAGTFAVYFSPANPAVSATFGGSISAVPETGQGQAIYDEATNAMKVQQVSGGTFAVYFDPSAPAVNATFSAATLETVPTTGSRILYDLGHQAVRSLIVGTSAAASLQVIGITNSIAVHLLSTGGTIHTYLDPGTTLEGIQSSVAVHLISTAGTIGVNVGKISDTIAVYLTATAGTLRVKLDPSSAGLSTDDAAFNVGSGTGSPMMALFDDTATDAVDEGDSGIIRMTGNRILLNNIQATAGIFTVSGSTSGGTTSGVTLVAPSASYNFKVFAYSLMSTGLTSEAWRFTNGAGTETELWRPLVTPASTTSETRGANGFIAPPAYLFATGVSTTLALKSSSGGLVHYSVSYIKESA